MEGAPIGLAHQPQDALVRRDKFLLQHATFAWKVDQFREPVEVNGLDDGRSSKKKSDNSAAPEKSPFSSGLAILSRVPICWSAVSPALTRRPSTRIWTAHLPEINMRGDYWLA